MKNLLATQGGARTRKGKTGLKSLNPSLPRPTVQG